MKKLVLTCFIIIYTIFPIFSQNQEDTTQLPEIYSWSVDSIGQISRYLIDTSLYNSHDFNPGVGHINLGHLGSPIQYNGFFEREHTDFLFSRPYKDYFRSNDNTHYFKTQTPYTLLKYATGGQQDTEARLWVRHTQNINEALNLGLDISLIGSKRFYENERSLKGRYLNFFGSFDENAYSLYTNVNLNKVLYKELGGIVSKSDFEVIDQRYIPGKLEGSNSTLKDQSFNIIQKLSLKETSFSELDVFEKLGERETFQKSQPAEKQDTLENGSPGTPRPNANQPDTSQSDTLPEKAVIKKDSTRFYAYHRLTYAPNEKRYEHDNPLAQFYSKYPIYMDSSKTRDRARQRSLRNRFRLVYSNPFLTGHAGIDYNILSYSHTYPYQPSDTAKDYDRLVTRNYNNFSLNAGWKFQTDSIFELWAQGKYYLTGFKGGDFNLKGGLSLMVGGNELSVEADYHYREPDYFYQHYNSNHFRWNNDLPKISKLELGGHFDIRDIKTRISLKPAVIHNYTYLDTSAQPAQYPQNLEIISASVIKNFTFWKFHSRNKLVFQYTDQYDLLGIPKLYLHHRFAFRHRFHFSITGGNLYTQLGWSVYYYPSYYADDYMPALGLYYRQRSEKVGNEPLFNLFVNFRIKRLNLFAKLYHLNSFIMERDYYTAPMYPMSPMMVKFGVSWSFYD